MRTLYLDFETYYDKEFSLSKLTTQEYITDPRFCVLMLSVALDDGPVVVLDADAIPEFLALLDPKDICVVSHNSVFDQLILSHHYGFVPALAGDTMALARALGWHVAAGGGSLDALSRALGEHMPELALPHKGTAVTNALGKHRGDFTDDQWVAYKDYCKTDTILLRHLWQQMLRYARETAPQTYPAMPVTEIAFEDLIIKCATDPRLMINVDVIDQELEDLEVRRVKILTDVQEHLGTATLEDTLYVLRSNNKFAAVLELMGAQAKYKTGVPMGNGDETGLNPEIVIPQKVSKTTGKWTWAFGKTDAGMQELAQHEDEAIAAVVNARLGTKSSIAQTRAEKFKQLAENGFLSIPYLICGAHTSRMSGREINCQNLPSGRVQNQSNALRRSIVPRQENQKLVVCDASQIEVRVASYIAGNYRTLQAFIEGKDIYVATASGLYQEDYDHILRKAKVEEDPEYKMKRQVAKAAELSCQFGTGARAFRNYAKVVGGVSLTKEQAKETVATWREVNWPIVQMWDIINNVLYRMIEGESGYFGGPNNDLFYFDGSRHVLGKHIPGIRMPSGLWINYRGLTTEPGQWPDGSPKTDFVYYQNKGKRLEKTYTYAAKVFENCIAEGTEVLTDSGWKPIECITSNDKVFDGEEFVHHEGLLYSGYKDCVTVDGVFMTPEHEVLVNGKWVQAREVASSIQRPDRAEGWDGYDTRVRIFSKPQYLLGYCLRMWKRTSVFYNAHRTVQKQKSNFALWLCNKKDTQSTPHKTRAIPHPVLQCVAFNEATLFEQKLSYISAIRGAWDNASRKLARFSEFLRRHVSNLSTRFMLRPDRQQQGIFKRQLSLGYIFGKQFQHQKINSYSCGWGIFNGKRIWQTFQPKRHHNTLPVEAGSTDARTKLSSGLRKHVFDIRNCGPRQRFVVRGRTQTLIVHNCTQGTAFQLMAWQAVNINRRYPISMNSHDEWAVVTDEPEAALQYMVECMTQAPPWLPGIPLAAEGSIADNYGDAK